MSKQPSKPRPALDQPTVLIYTPLPSEWTNGNRRYEIVTTRLGWWLRTYLGGRMTCADWYADVEEAALREAIQETKR